MKGKEICGPGPETTHVENIHSKKKKKAHPNNSRKKQRGVSFAKEPQVTFFRKGERQFTNRKENLPSPITAHDPNEDVFDSKISISSPGSRIGEATSDEGEPSNRVFEDNIPDNYQMCFRQVEEDPTTEWKENSEADNVEDNFHEEGEGDKRTMIPITQIEDEGENRGRENESLTDSYPKALAIVPLVINKKKNENDEGPESFGISREIVIMLKKNNLCIRPIGGTSAKRVNTTRKRRNREVTNLLRTWEKETEIETAIGK